MEFDQVKKVDCFKSFVFLLAINYVSLYNKAQMGGFNTRGTNMPTLKLYQDYSRQDIHTIFSPRTRITPNAGTWGLQGIVSVPETNDYVFFATIGSQQGDHSLTEGITDNGVLTWQ